MTKLRTGVLVALSVGALSAAACGSASNTAGGNGDSAAPTGIAAAPLPPLPQPTSAQTAAWDKVSGPVYFLTPDVASGSPRWTQDDLPLLQAAFAKFAPKVTVKQISATGGEQQANAVDSAVANHAKGIVLAPFVGATNTTGMLKAAQAANIPVLGYSTDLFDVPYDRSTGVGEPIAQDTVNLTHQYMAAGCQYLAQFVSGRAAGAKPLRVALLSIGNTSPSFILMNKNCNAYLQPAIAAHKVELVCQYHVTTFAPADAQKELEQCLTHTHDGVDAVLTHNDDVAAGAVAALQAQHLQGKVKVYGGYDSTLAGIQRVVAGWQAFDQLPPFQQQAWVGAEYLLSRMAKTAPPAGYPNAYYWNGLEYPSAKQGVPALIFKNYFITSPAEVQKDIVDEHIYTKAQVCARSGVAADTAWCKGSAS